MPLLHDLLEEVLEEPLGGAEGELGLLEVALHEHAPDHALALQLRVQGKDLTPDRIHKAVRQWYRDRAVDETGGQIAVFGRIGSRPFTRKEMEAFYLRPDGRLWTVTDKVEKENYLPKPKVNSVAFRKD